jgi:membrane-bound lytic murein transglycosylase D
MPFSRKLFLTGATVLALGAFSTSGFASQNPSTSSPSLEKTQNTQKEANLDPVQKTINAAEQQYNSGAQQFSNGEYDQARAAFDRAVDTLLEAEADVRRDPRFHSYYLELVEKIYRQQLNAMQSGKEGFSQQNYESSPLDELSKIDLDAEGVSRTGTVEVKGFDFEFTPSPAVVQFINFFTQGKGRSTMEIGLRKSGRFRSLAERVFKEEGVPLDIIWLAQVESVWTPYALSSASAKGIWQFIPSTGERFGLRQDGWIDERVSPEKATRAAARYLKFLNGFFAGDWLLAMAAYNSGEHRVDKAIARCGYADFWELYNRNLLPQETRNYVPAILAVMIIAKNPQKYGFDVQPEEPWKFDTFEVKRQVDLRVVANLMDISYEYIRELNPELKRGATPPEGFTIRLPKNSREQFEVAFNNLSPNQYTLSSSREMSMMRRSSGLRTHNVGSRHGRYRVKNATAKRVYQRGRRR